MSYPPGFLEFWAIYPRKTGKQPAGKAWEKAKAEGDALLWEAISRDIERRERIGWFKSRSADKIPHAATYINQRRWEDENIEEEVDEKFRPRRAPPPRREDIQTPRVHDAFWAAASRLWMIFNRAMILGRHQTITLEAARECAVASRGIAMKFKAYNQNEEDHQEYHDLVMAMAGELLSQWKTICGIDMPSLKTFEDLSRINIIPK